MTKAKAGPRHAYNVARRQRAFELARQRLRLLIASMGGRCAICEEDDYTLLAVDHVDGITWPHCKLRYDARVGRYVTEYKSGVRLRVLCIVCNGRDGRLRYLEEAPF